MKLASCIRLKKSSSICKLETRVASGSRSIRKRHVRRVVLLTAVPTAKIERENPYHDRIERDVLVYAAAGLRGDQSLGGANKRLASQPVDQFPIYGFRLTASRRKAGVRRWEFLGLLQFLRHYPDLQVDRDGSLRRVWLFELRVCAEFAKVPILHEQALTRTAFADFKFDAEREVRADPESLGKAISDVRVNAEAVERVRARIFALDPRGFEFLVQQALERTGFVEVSVTRFTQDNGVDVNARVPPLQWLLRVFAFNYKQRDGCTRLADGKSPSFAGAWNPSHKVLLSRPVSSRALLLPKRTRADDSQSSWWTVTTSPLPSSRMGWSRLSSNAGRFQPVQARVPNRVF